MSLHCSDLSVDYGKVRIIWDVSLDLEPGRALAVLGKNGMGKTTLLKGLMGLATRSSGAIAMCGEEVTGWPTHRIVRLGVSYVAQDKPVFGELTVEENLRLVGLRGAQFRSALADVTDMFPRVGERLAQKAGTLSGGERKMLMVARALLPRPALVVLDEVSEGLQPSMRDLFARVLNGYREQCGAAVLVVEQNLEFALGVADSFAVLSGGRIVEQGVSDDAAAVAQIDRHMTL
jgi:branched-chain amino acid transport system ATP-binding protein